MAPVAGIEFLRPEALWLLVPVPVWLWFLLSRERLRRTLANRFVSEQLRGFDPVRRARPWLLALSAAMLIIALAGPTKGERPVPVSMQEADLVVAVDVSESMAAEDVGTSRLSAARAVSRALLERWNGRAGLVVFEGAADVISPLTSDLDAVLSLLESVGTGEVGEPGSDLAAGVAAALRLTPPGTQPAALVMLSDGENRTEGAQRAIDLARERGVPVVTVMLGTETGARIPAGNGYLRDETGVEVVTKANPAILRQLAVSSGGAAFENPFTTGELRAVVEAVRQRQHARDAERQATTKIERFQWPLGAAVLLLLAASRANRGIE